MTENDYTSAGLQDVPSRVPDPVPLGPDGYPNPPLCACMRGILTEAAYDGERHYPGDPGCAYPSTPPESGAITEAAYCPFKGRCEHPDCLLDVEQCVSALVASARVTQPGEKKS